MALTVRPDGHASIGKLSDLIEIHEQLTSELSGIHWHFSLVVKSSQEPLLIFNSAVKNSRMTTVIARGGRRRVLVIDPRLMTIGSAFLSQVLQARSPNLRPLEHIRKVVPPGQVHCVEKAGRDENVAGTPSLRRRGNAVS